jgi:hypothetical protein
MQRRLAKRMAAVIGVAAVLAFAAAGCGTKTIEHSSEIDLVNKQLKQDGLTAESIDCPDDVEAKEGDTFTCDVTATNGHTGTYTITIEKVEGDNASLQVTGATDTTKK